IGLPPLIRLAAKVGSAAAAMNAPNATGLRKVSKAGRRRNIAANTTACPLVNKAEDRRTSKAAPAIRPAIPASEIAVAADLLLNRWTVVSARAMHSGIVGAIEKVALAGFTIR